MEIILKSIMSFLSLCLFIISLIYLSSSKKNININKKFDEFKGYEKKYLSLTEEYSKNQNKFIKQYEKMWNDSNFPSLFNEEEINKLKSINKKSEEILSQINSLKEEYKR